jgi:Rrf2 family iron-sulfur cluster assembly transcriptional regulator
VKLTTKGKFAVTALLDIAIYCDGNTKPITLYNISERQNISLSYLEQLFVKLRKSNIVKSFKGPGGGYVLGHDLAKIPISDIIKAVDEDMDARTCRGDKNCKDNGKCLTHDLWAGLTKELYNYLDKITLQDLLNKANKKDLQEIVFCRT